MNSLSCFKSLDIRGKVNLEIDTNLCYQIACAYANFLQAKNIVIGGDARLTTPEFKQATIDGLLDSGVNVIDIGLCGTEEIYFATSYLATDGGIMITASHNPIDYNGLKFVAANSIAIAGDSGLQEIKQLVIDNNYTPRKQAINRGSLQQQSILSAYVDKILSFINIKTLQKPLKILINVGNGMAGHVIDAIAIRFQQLQLPIKLIQINATADGNFPNGVPNPLLIENRQQTSEAILQYQADFGIAFDGDFDRCFLFDAEANFIDGYYIVGLLAQAFLLKNPASHIVFEPRMIWNTVDIIEQHAGIAELCVSGHSFIKQKMRQVDAVYGGEISAHHYFRDFYYCDSGMITWLLITEMLSQQSLSLAELVKSRIALYPASGEINSVVKQPKIVIQKVKQFYQQQALKCFDFDGLNMEFENWRFNLRIGNTEPLLRVNIETRADTILLQAKIDELLAIIRTE